MKNEALPATINGAYVDRFTLAHALAGVVAAYWKVTPIQAVVLAVGWEIGEDWLKDRYPSLFPHPSVDTKENALVDVGAFLVAYTMARKTQE